MIHKWRNKERDNHVILMMDLNKELVQGNPLHFFTTHNNLIDAVATLNPALKNDKTFLHGSKRIDHIFITPELAEIATKAGHHHFHQHFASDHKGIYLHFKVGDLFESPKIDRSHFSHRNLQLQRRDIVKKYLEFLNDIYESNNFIPRLRKAVHDVEKAKTKPNSRRLLKPSTKWTEKGFNT